MSHSFDYEPPRRGGAAVVWTCLTVLVLLAVLAVVCVFFTIFTNPHSVLNPFPPPTLVPLASLPSETPTPVVITLPPSWTPAPSDTPPPTETPTPTDTLPPTPTPIELTPTPSLTLPPPAAGYPYEVRVGSPRAIPNIYHPELACAWMGVGGQVVDMNDAPVTGLIIRLGGRAPGISIEENTFTLTGVALNYGRAGYEFKLADQPVASSDALWIQLLNQAGVPLSPRVSFNTYASCEQNLIIIDFKQVR